MKTIIFLVYLAIGVVVAATKDYLGDVGSIGEILNLVLAVLLWPLVLLGVDFDLKIGGGDDKNGGDKNGGDKGGDKKKGALMMLGPGFAYARAYAGSRLSSARRDSTT